MKIIILDDSLTIRMIIESLLDELGVEEDEIYSFDEGTKALDFIAINGADIVFSDINMPNMNGYEFAKSVFKIMPHLQRTFFAISGSESRKVYQDMKAVGVHHFMKKPIKAGYFRHFILPEIIKIKLKTSF